MSSSLRQPAAILRRRFRPSPQDLLARASLSLEKFATTRLAYGIAGLADNEFELEKLVRANASHTWRYYRDFMRLSDPAERSRLQRSVSAVNLDLLSQALTRGRGAVLASAHLGDFDLAGSWLLQSLGAPVVVVVNRISPRPRQAMFSRARHAAGITTRFGDETRLGDLERDLERGSVVVVMLDRRSPGGTVPVNFFGSRAVASPAPWVLSARTGAPIFTGGMKTLPSSARLARLVAAYDAQSLEAPSIQEGTQRLVEDIETMIRWAPEQWHVPTQRAQLLWEA